LGGYGLKFKLSEMVQEAPMARVCEICGKGKQIGNNVSHANNKTKREWLPNLQSIKIVKNGTVTRTRICSKCIKKGDFKKAV